MNKLTHWRHLALYTFILSLFTGAVNAATDSFFDVFFDIEVAESTSPADLRGVATIMKGEREPTTVPIEILSMDLTSSSLPPLSDGSAGKRYNGIVKYRLSNIGSSGQDGVRFVEVDIVCDPACMVINTRAKGKKKHKRHMPDHD
ncbi:hypothetical protein Ssed_2642 [Shewanella sediminis HAW-EB3]|uniref:Uncharacterized protein n=1 Tax=Shewanella sediminis (strain HAW-EB3) TaxID=425104 RepID=A8FWM6_SHESH|nr:hypothetical protein [Shewanella sediminis]ABV37249.1 hypothetical protein Ssed_2642 [Shewanella sediminis HAW-EB3]